MNASDIASKLYASSILIVDDDSTSRHYIERALRHKGFRKIYTADSGEAALSHIKRLPPELVILDISMAGISGLECCSWIRTQPHLKDLPVLMLTSLTNESVRLQSFAAGATDFVSKPLHPDELYSRVKVHLLNRLAMKSLQAYKNRLDFELQNARDLQSAILPTPQKIAEVRQEYNLEVASYMNTSSEIGGDFWGLKNLMFSQVALWIVDFSGHGVAAALNAFRLQAYLNEHSILTEKPGEYLSHLNDKLVQLLLRGHFSTMFYGIVNIKENRLYYACACSPHPLILKKNGKVKRLDGSGTPLGIAPQQYPTMNVDFQPGDTLVLYSDAMTETSNAEGAYITEDHIAAILTAHKGESAETLKETLLTYFHAHSAEALADDLTFCLCRRESV